MARQRAHTIVIGNEKGGCGKSTIAMNLAAALLHQGRRVCTIDLDARQGSFTRYQANREAYIASTGAELPLADHHALYRSDKGDMTQARADDERRFLQTFYNAILSYDAIVVDCPGHDTPLARIAHSFADTIITPFNDSLIDLDLIANLDPETLAVREIGVYAKTVQEQIKRHPRAAGREVRWLLLRNRLSHIDANNKRKVGAALEQIAAHLGCGVVAGFGERVIYRELFLSGLTVLDLPDPSITGSKSHRAARNELDALLAQLDELTRLDFSQNIAA
ncbi:MAG: division plane positioning ATPase MipZ [Geminicoccaceae bacterium]